MSFTPVYLPVLLPSGTSKEGNVAGAERALGRAIEGKVKKTMGKPNPIRTYKPF